MQHCHLLASKVTKKEGCPANSGTICACHPKLDSVPPSEAEAATVPRFGRIKVSGLGCSFFTVLYERGLQSGELRAAMVWIFCAVGIVLMTGAQSLKPLTLSSLPS